MLASDSSLNTISQAFSSTSRPIYRRKWGEKGKKINKKEGSVNASWGGTFQPNPVNLQAVQRGSRHSRTH